MLNETAIVKQLAQKIQKLLPPKRTRRGRPRKDPTKLLLAIRYVLRSGCRWKDLPQQKFGCHYTTCWRFMRLLMKHGIWQKIHTELLGELDASGRIDWSHCALDTSTVAAPKGGMPQEKTLPTAASAAQSGI